MLTVLLGLLTFFIYPLFGFLLMSLHIIFESVSFFTFFLSFQVSFFFTL